MAGDWIKMRKGLVTDPRIVRIMSALQADRFRTLGGVFSAWCLFDEHTEDGRLDGYTPEVFDELIGFPGLARAMASVGWLEIGEDFLLAPRFGEHNGKSAKKRCQDNDRKASSRQADVRPFTKQTKHGPEKIIEEKRVNTLSLDDVRSQSEHWKSAGFREVWSAWLAHSVHERGQPMSDASEQQQLYSLAGRNTDDVITLVRYSIQRNAKNLILNGDHNATVAKPHRPNQHHQAEILT